MLFPRKKPVEIIGYVLTIVSLIYMASILAGIDFSEWQANNPFLTLSLIVGFGVVASSSVLIGAYSWKLILEFVNGAPVSTMDVYRVYLNSNIAKYLPGNVMHYAGRNILGSKLGWKNTEMAFSSFLEYLFGFGLTGLIIVLFAALGLVSFPAHFTLELNETAVLRISVIGTLFCFVALMATFIYRFFVVKERFEITAEKMYGYTVKFFTKNFFKLMMKMLCITLLSFVINCVFYFYLCDVILNFPIRPADFFNIGVALSIAGYASILTPGVPGGIGVKESVSILLLSAYGYPKEGLLLTLLVFRVTCILGDLLPFIALKISRR